MDIIKDANQIGYGLQPKGETTIIHDDIEEASRLFTHVHINGRLMPGLTTYSDTPLYYKIL